MGEDKLKPCPFCGGKAIIDRDFLVEDGDRWTICSGCGVVSVAFSTEQQAIEAWNRRA